MPIECVPATICNNTFYQSPASQDYLMLQLLCAISTALGGTPTCTVAGFQDAAAPWLCQGSPNAINAQIANMIAENLADVDLSQPICLAPSELAGAKAALVCAILNVLEIVPT